MAEDRSSKIQALDIESNIERRFEEMEQTLIRIQQEDTATNESSQWRPQPTDWNARNMTPIEVSAILTMCYQRRSLQIGPLRRKQHHFKRFSEAVETQDAEKISIC